MKKIFLTALCAVMAFGISSCGGAAAVQDESASEAPSGVLLEEGKFKVGMEIAYPPFEYYTDDMQPMGLDVDLANEIASRLGADAEFIDTEFDVVLEGLGNDLYDAVISAVTINGSRQQTVDFSSPYIENWQAIVVKAGSEAITSMDGLAGKSVGMQDGTTSTGIVNDLIATGGLEGTEPMLYDEILSAFDDLNLGRVDCVLTDSTVAEGYLEREPGVYEITWHQKDEAGAESEKFAVAVKKGNADLLDAINNALSELEGSGRLEEMRGEWLS